MTFRHNYLYNAINKSVPFIVQYTLVDVFAGWSCEVRSWYMVNIKRGCIKRKIRRIG